MNEITLYTTNEVAKILKIDRRNVYRYVKDGRLRASKIGGEWRVSQDDLKAFINRDTNEQVAKND